MCNSAYSASVKSRHSICKKVDHFFLKAIPVFDCLDEPLFEVFELEPSPKDGVGRLPGVKAFGGRYKRLTDRTAKMLRADLSTPSKQKMAATGTDGKNDLAFCSAFLAGNQWTDHPH